MGRLCLRSSSTGSQDNDSGYHSPVILPQHFLILPGIARKFSVLLLEQIERLICQKCFIEQRKDKNCILPCRENKIRSESILHECQNQVRGPRLSTTIRRIACTC